MAKSTLNKFFKIPLPKHNYFHDRMIHSNPYSYTHTQSHSIVTKIMAPCSAVCIVN